METQKCCDGLTFYMVDDNKLKTVFNWFYGSYRNASFLLPSNPIYVVFRSDISYTSQGFSAEVQEGSVYFLYFFLFMILNIVGRSLLG